MGVHFQLFSDPLKKNIWPSPCHFELVNGCEMSCAQYNFTPFSSWEELFTKKVLADLSWSIVSLGYCFLPFRIQGKNLQKGTFGVLFSVSFSNSLNMKILQDLPMSDSLNLDDIGLFIMTRLSFSFLGLVKIYQVGFFRRTNLYYNHMLSSGTSLNEPLICHVCSWNIK